MRGFGLTSEQARDSLKNFGSNALTQPPRETFWDKLLGNFQDPIIRILILALLVNACFVFIIQNHYNSDRINRCFVIQIGNWIFS